MRSSNLLTCGNLGGKLSLGERKLTRFGAAQDSFQFSQCL
jgi:hypothetical protein